MRDLSGQKFQSSFYLDGLGVVESKIIVRQNFGK